MVRSGALSPGHARAIISIDDKDYLINLAKQACDNKLTVREIETESACISRAKQFPADREKREKFQSSSKKWSTI